jgi:hypothetical protein
MKWNEIAPIYSFTLKIRHPKEGHFNSHCVKPPLPAQRTRQMNEWMAHTNQRLLGSNVKQRGNVKRSALGECSLRKDTLEWKLRMKVDFHHKFVGEGVDGVSTVKLTHPINSLTHSSKWTDRPTINFISTARFTTTRMIIKMKSGRIGTGMYPFSFPFLKNKKKKKKLPTSAWSCKTGKRNYESHPFFLNEWISTHHVGVFKPLAFVLDFQWKRPALK